MARYLISRLAAAVGVLLGTTLVVFLVLHATPGDPAKALVLGQGATPEQIVELRKQLGLDEPLWQQYVAFLASVARGDIGYSYLNHQPVRDAILIRLPSTLALAGGALVLGTALGGVAGVLSGMSPNGLLDRFVMLLTIVAGAVPYFWLALLLVLVFAINLHWLPAIAIGSPTDLVLPVVSLAWVLAAVIARLLRDSLVRVYESPYVLAARARGFSEARILARHALRNAAAAVVTVLGLEFGGLLTGAVAIEFIFGRNGVGSYLFQAMQNKDIPVVQGTVLVVAAAYVVTNLIVDIAYGVLDPKVRAEWGTPTRA